MNPNELRELADKIMDCLRSPEHLGWYVLLQDYAAYLREQADRQEKTEPIGWIEGPHGALRANPDYRFQGPQTVAWSFHLYLHPAPQSVPEVDVLRAMQSAAVMPLIGPLLDAWDGMPNDFKGEMREEVPDLTDALRKIGRAMDGQAIAASPAAPAEGAQQWTGIARAEQIADEASEDYVFEGDAGCYTPTDGERFMLLDFVMGLLADDEFVSAIRSVAPAPADVVEALRELVAYVDEPAGFNAALATDTDSFVAFMDAIEQKRKAIVERARAALAAVDKERG